MSHTWKGLVLVGAFTAVALVPRDGTAAGQVTPTKDDCTTAWAILIAHHPSVHGGFPHPDFMEAVQNVVRWHPHWNSELPDPHPCPTGTSGYQPGCSQKFSLCSADLKFVEGGGAVVAHCGHGATCNELAREVLKAYPELGSPGVYCTIDPPVVLENVSGC
jgi:hypothetical protein